MSSHQQLPPLDPRLGATRGTHSPSTLPYERPQPPPPSQHSAAYPPSNSQPYYSQYADGHSRGPSAASALSTGHQSAQASPSAPGYHGTPDTGEHSGDDGNGGPQHAEDAKRARACEACRGLKVRCDQDPSRPDVPCRRCQKAGRQCIITAPSRRRMKKADSRVADLEKKLDALTAALQQQNAQIPHGLASQLQQVQDYAHSRPVPAPSQYDRPPSAGSSMQPPQKRQRMDESSGRSMSSGYTPTASRSEDPSAGDQSQGEMWPRLDLPTQVPARSQEEFLSRVHSLISPDVGATLFNRYVDKMAPNMPAVIFPPTTTARDLSREKPILYVCILSAASFSVLSSHLCRELAREAVRAIAECVVVNGAKSLELIQAMQVMTLWYRPPDRSEQSNFYQIIHMAAIMAVDIGLGKRFNAAKARRGFGNTHSDAPSGQPLATMAQNSDTVEARRAWLVCYYMCASASMVLRRPNLIHWSNYMKECVEILETSPEATPSDRMLCQHIKIQHICEEIGVQFLMDDTTATISITDPKVTYTLNVLENDLKAWKDNIPADLKSHPSLIFFEHVANLYLHEIALHFNHNVEDFRLPFTEESLRTVSNSSETLTSHQVAALIACKKGAHGILDTFLAYDVEAVKALPILIFFVRCTYSIVILIKLHVASSTPNNEISKMMSPNELKVEEYLEGLMNMFGQIARDANIHPKPKILQILTLLMDWFRKHQANVQAQARGEQITQSSQQPEQALKQEPGERSRYNQSPLDLLSQVATGNSRPPAQPHSSHNTSSSSTHNWTFNSPYPIDPASRPAPGHPDNQFPLYQQQQQQQQQTPTTYTDTSYAGPTADIYGMVDPYVWGSGFQQAMDLNLGGMEGLGGSGIDGLFMGDGMLPFGGTGEMM